MSWYENVLWHFEMVVGHILDIVDVLSCWRLLRNCPLVFCLVLSGLLIGEEITTIPAVGLG